MVYHGLNKALRARVTQEKAIPKAATRIEILVMSNGGLAAVFAASVPSAAGTLMEPALPVMSPITLFSLSAKDFFILSERVSANLRYGDMKAWATLIGLEMILVTTASHSLP